MFCRGGVCGRSSLWFSLWRSLCFSLRRSSLGFSLWRSLCFGLRRSLGFCLHPRRRSVLFHGQRLGGNQRLWLSAIGLGKRGLVGLGRNRVLRLELGRSHMRLVCDRLLGGRGRVLNAVRTAVVRHVIGVGHDAPLHNRPVNVGGVNDGLIHMHHRGVVSKVPAPPLAAGKADAPVAGAVVHAAVVANVVAPVAVMEPVPAAGPPPVRRRPQRAAVRSRHPGARHPVVVPIVIRIGPVPRRPHQVGFGAYGLYIDRQLGRSKSDADDELCVRRCRNHRYEQSKQEPTRRAKQSHEKNLLVLSSLLRWENRITLSTARAWELPSYTSPSPIPGLFKIAQEVFAASILSSYAVSSGSSAQRPKRGAPGDSRERRRPLGRARASKLAVGSIQYSPPPGRCRYRRRSADARAG
jgi:hypothetical protein